MELRRRNVFRVALAYILVAWLILQVGDTLAPALRLPDWVNSAVAFFLILGFPLAVFFAWAYELTPEGLKPEKDVDRSQSITHLTGRKLDYVIIAVLSVALVVLAFDRFVRNPARDATPAQVTPEAGYNEVRGYGDASVVDKSIAVLPFENLSADAEQEYFADGLAEEILIVLSRVPSLEVAPRSSSFAYKGDNRGISQIAEEIGVNYILAGSVRRAQDRVRIFAELVNVDTRDQLWSNIFEGELSDVFAIQDEIAHAIGRSLSTSLVDNRGNPIIASGTNDVSAHNAYLKGRYLLNRRGIENVRSAVSFFETATELDANYAEAHAALAYAKSIGWGQQDPQGAKRSAARAIELDRSLPMAWIAIATSASSEFSFDEAEMALREALALEPRNATAWHTLAFLYYTIRGPDEALEPALRAVSLDPSSPIFRLWLGNYYMALGNIGEGMTHLDTAMKMDAEVFEAPLVWKAAVGDLEGALAVLATAEKIVEISENEEAWHRAFIHVVAGRIDDARSLVAGREMLSIYDAPDVIVILKIGNLGEADKIIEAGFANGYTFPQLRYLARHIPDNRIDETRYNELLSSAGLPRIDGE